MIEFDFSPEQCWYREVCSLSETSDCSISCIRFSQIKHLIKNSGLPYKLCFPIPLEPVQADMDSFYRLRDIKENIVDFVKEGKNLYIFSNNFGNGKTTWSAKIMLKYFDSIWSQNGYQTRGLFIPVTEFLLDLKQNITLRDCDIYLQYQRIKSVDLVIWDDIGVTGVSPMDLESLYALINHRIQSGLSNIFTGNLTEHEIENTLGPRLKSRIWNASECIELLGEDRRNGFTSNSK